MIVYKDIKGYNLKEIIENYITMLWDLGLKIGHRVHEIKDLFPASNEDITIKTAMLESRFIYGSKFLWYEIQNELNKIRNYNKKEYILAKYEEMLNRHKKFPISMEPNIKDGFGGIRDSNTLLWINKVIFNYPNNAYLVPKFASEEEFKEYRSALEFLFKVRVYLHLAAKKKIDTVLLTYQREIALNMGYSDSPRIKAERKFIRDLLKSLWSVNTFTSILIKKLIKPYLYSHTFSQMKNKRIKPYYYLCEDTIYTTFNNKQNFKEIFTTLLEIDFKKYDVSIVSTLKEKKHKLSKKLKKELFYKKNLYPFLFALYKSGKLEKIIPAFEKIKHLAQFDGYHQYPVDIHSIMTLYNVENIRYRDIENVYKNLPKDKKRILKIVALFHDLGKGRLKDHHLVGEKLVEIFMKNLEFEETEIYLAKKVVKYHTLLSNVAQREDIDNDKVLLNFANIVEDKITLDILYILTYADMEAVGKGIFNSYKKYLITTLYKNTLEVIENRELLLLSSKRNNKEKLLKKESHFLQLPKEWQKKVLDSPSSQLFIKNSVDRIVQIVKKMYQTESYQYSISTTPLSVEIIKRGINFDLGYFLAKLSYSVTHIAIYKVDDVKYFKIDFEEEGDEWSVAELIEKSFKTNSYQFKNPGIKWEEFTLDCNHSKNYLALKLKTTDKKGIISFVMYLMDKYGIDVEDIKISVQRDVVRDILIINKNSGFCEIYQQFLEEFR
jgi:[protein-PII] uridylyltransferase